MLFAKVGTVILLVSNMAKSIKFYKDILELPIKTKSSDWVEFFARDTTLALHPLKSKRKNIKPSSAGGGVLVGIYGKRS